MAHGGAARLAGAPAHRAAAVRAAGLPIPPGGAPIPPSTVTAFRETFGHYIHNVYGLTETTSPSHGTPFGTEGPVDEASGALSVGVPVYDTVVQIVDDDGNDARPGQTGELLVKGPGVLRGYWRDDEATAAVLDDDGWLRTGDLARKGPLNSVVFAGRKKDVIKRGGFSVYAVEVEAVLEEHPAVVEAAVVGRVDERLGEVPVAAIRLADGYDLVKADLDAWIREHLSHYKIPVHYLAVDDFPRTGTNKIQRREVAALFT